MVAYPAYRSIILVEGIFDCFAFYAMLQDQDKQVMVSTVGSYLTPEAATILKGLDIENYIVVYERDELGRSGIEGWRPNLAGGSIALAAWPMVRPLTIFWNRWPAPTAGFPWNAVRYLE